MHFYAKVGRPNLRIICNPYDELIGRAMEGNIIFLHCQDLNVIGIIILQEKRMGPLPFLAPTHALERKKEKGPRRSSGGEELEMRQTT